MSVVWLRPATRTIQWRPLVAVGALLCATSALAAGLGEWPVSMAGTAAGALAAATVAGLPDRAGELLSALPSSAATRQLRRLALVVPVAVLLWSVYLLPGPGLPGSPTWSLAPMLALLMTGVAAFTIAPAPWTLPGGVALPLIWALAARVAGPSDGPVAEVVLAWHHHPWPVIAAALTITLVRRLS